MIPMANEILQRGQEVSLEQAWRTDTADNYREEKPSSRQRTTKTDPAIPQGLNPEISAAVLAEIIEISNTLRSFSPHAGTHARRAPAPASADRFSNLLVFRRRSLSSHSGGSPHRY